MIVEENRGIDQNKQEMGVADENHVSYVSYNKYIENFA